MIVNNYWENIFSSQSECVSYLQENPSYINAKDKRMHLVEYLINNEEYTLLRQLAGYIDLTLPSSTGGNTLLNLLIMDNAPKTIEAILAHNPQVINFCGSNGTHPVEHMLVSEEYELIQKYAQFINAAHICRDGDLLITKAIKDDATKTVAQLLHYHPEVLNAIDSNGIYLSEHMIKNEFYDNLQKFSQYINLNLPATNHTTILGMMALDDMNNTMTACLNHNPLAINVAGPNGVVISEYLIRRQNSTILQKFAKFVDLSLPCSQGENLLHFITSQDMPKTFAAIAKHQLPLMLQEPQLTNIKAPVKEKEIEPITEKIEVVKTLEEIRKEKYKNLL